MNFLVALLLYALYLFLGGFWMREAIRDFRDGRTFWFGFDVMCGTYILIKLAQLALGI